MPCDNDVALPRWAYVPGEGSVADRDTLERIKAFVPASYDGFVSGMDPALRYGLSLNDHGFFWEAHEILEAIWKVAPKGSPDRILLRACIQIANANLKMTMERPRAARRLLLDAAAELDEVAIRMRSGICNGFISTFPLDHVRGSICELLNARWLDTSQAFLCLSMK